MHASSPLRSSPALLSKLFASFITTTISVVCPYAIVFVSRYRDFLRKLLDFASPIVRDHYAALSPSWLLTFSNVCEPCDGGSMDMSSVSHCSYHPFPCRNALRPNTNERPMPWRLWMYRNLHLAFSLYDDALATIYARLLHLHALQTAAWLQNRLPRSTRNWQSPFHLLSRMLPSVENVYAFARRRTCPSTPSLRTTC